MEPSHLDEHCRFIEAPIDACWEALLGALPAFFSGPGKELFARAVGCEVVGRDHGPVEEGFRFPGFRVVQLKPPELLVARGSHRFSTYALIFRLEDRGGGTHLCAETKASFPGIRGAIYRAAVVGSRGHVVVVSRMLTGVERRATRGSGTLGQNTP